MIIRKAELRDVPALHDLINRFARERVMLPRTLEDLYENVWSFTVAEDAGRVVGCGALRFYNQELAEIRSLCVETGRASHGVGSALVERLLNDAENYGLKSIFALTLVPAFFRKCGFRETRREKFPLKMSQDCARCDRSIVADGGIRYAGDVVKALAFGADFVMVGGLLAGTRPTPGEKRQDASGRWVKSYRGMASREVADELMGGLSGWKTAEGVSVDVPYREDEDAIVADLVGGLRSGLTYAGSKTIKELQRKLNYVVITPSGWREGTPHRLL